MKNLFLFLYRNNYTIIFILIEILCLTLIIRNNNFQNASAFNSSNKIVGAVMEVVNYVNEYIDLKATNKNVVQENARLRSLLPDAYYESNILKNTVNDTLRHKQYSFFVAKVINNSMTRRNNYLTLDKGALQGVKPEMGVITSQGVVGIVKNVSWHYCTVMSMLHKDMRISAKFKNNNYFGSLAWEGSDPTIAVLKDIAKHVVFQKGDTVVTTSYSAVFPENILIGTVAGADIKPGENFYSIQIKLSTNFSNLTYVYVVDNMLKSEQRKLEDETVNNDH
ncbi:MAG TPA: rod shape-determining protein MreC [Bacteroidia bacterium]|nr:rod shape-determining protein MreC [Bacteroidia bacterium]